MPVDAIATFVVPKTLIHARPTVIRDFQPARAPLRLTPKIVMPEI